MPPVTTLTVLCDEYHGHDFGHPDNPPIDTVAGENIDVSEDKAKQLLADFPDSFATASAAGKAAAKKAAAEKRDDAAAAAKAPEAAAAPAETPETPATQPTTKRPRRPRAQAEKA